MERRRFLIDLCGISAASYATYVLAGCSTETTASRSSSKAYADRVIGKIQSFAYYEGLGPTEDRDPARSDGTTYKMPCISPEDVDAGVDKLYDFWHGHDGMIHRFTVTASDFTRLKLGESVEIFTSLVEGHRHSLLIAPTSPCEAVACR